MEFPHGVALAECRSQAIINPVVIAKEGDLGISKDWNFFPISISAPREAQLGIKDIRLVRPIKLTLEHINHSNEWVDWCATLVNPCSNTESIELATNDFFSGVVQLQDGSPTTHRWKITHCYYFADFSSLGDSDDRKYYPWNVRLCWLKTAAFSLELAYVGSRNKIFLFRIYSHLRCSHFLARLMISSSKKSSESVDYTMWLSVGRHGDRVEKCKDKYLGLIED